MERPFIRVPNRDDLHPNTLHHLNRADRLLTRAYEVEIGWENQLGRAMIGASLFGQRERDRYIARCRALAGACYLRAGLAQDAADRAELFEDISEEAIA